MVQLQQGGARGSALRAYLWATVAPVLVRGQGAAASPGSDDCRCVNPWGGVPSGSDANCRRQLSFNRQHHYGRPDGEQVVCVPDDYGAGVCAAHDDVSFNAECRDSDGSVVSGAPEWCTARWCFVDAQNCTRPMSPADLVMVNGEATAQELSLSYETCGNLNAYSAERHYESLRGQHLRMSFPGDSGSGYTLVTLDHTTNQPCANVWEAQGYASKGACVADPQNTKTGSVVEFIRSLAEDPNPAGSKPSTSFASGVCA